MKCVINGTTYIALDNLHFNPQTDLTGDSIPINEFEVRLFTNDIIAYGQYAELRDDEDNLWARYWISYAERIGRDVDRGTYIVRLIAESTVAFLERVKIPAKMYNATATAVLNDILTLAGQPGAITLEASVQSEWDSTTITGFCPEQTARERFLWLLLCAGGYVKSFFETGIKIDKVDTATSVIIPIEKTYWKPSISHRDYVTAIKVHAYTFTAGTPHNTDTYVTDGTQYYIQSEQVITLSNNMIPAGVPENVVEIEGVTMVSPSSASTILQNLVAYYFNRMEVDLDCIDNGEYIPGDLVIAYTDEDQMVRGYIDQTDFAFGLQAKGRLHLTAAADVEGVLLILHYKWDDVSIARRGYFLPKDYEYSITTEYLDWTMMGHRYIFRPLTGIVSGTLTENTEVVIQCEVALDGYSVKSRDDNIGIINQEYLFLYNCLKEYYKPQIYQHESDAKRTYKEIIDVLSGIYQIKKDEVKQETNILKILSVDELTQSNNVINIA